MNKINLLSYLGTRKTVLSDADVSNRYVSWKVVKPIPRQPGNYLKRHTDYI